MIFVYNKLPKRQDERFYLQYYVYQQYEYMLQQLEENIIFAMNDININDNQ